MKRCALVAVILFVVVLMLPTVALAVDPVPLEPPLDPAVHVTVPADTPLYIPAGWFGGTRGMTMQAPRYIRFYCTITKHTASGDAVVLDMTEQESTAYWLPGVAYVSDGSDIPFFNAHIGAGVYSKDWRLDLPDGLTAGEYSVVSGCYQTKTIFDLLWYFDGQRSPMKMQAGDYPFPDWDFTVQ